ncbi:hypothetical protein I316_01008 [Kwoniella heveanensis BCC8398]|uniref:Uncharacterized protein n=1 Tax=Kwoniella heveanensis BCC8398 TaxID=1296120 RepID=A0A1B9H1E9_9TREE|nr:hypothetical protein I316_01008 [Kwoniella heveanensis BCC8398]
MTETPLVIPFLVDADLPTFESDLVIPARPTHIASWTIDTSGDTTAGSSRRTALADSENTIWIITEPEMNEVENENVKPKLRPKPKQLFSPELVPSIQTQAASSPTSPVLSPRRLRPSTQRNLSYSGRPRNTSSASSVVSSSSKRRTSAFSPPPSALQLPTATLSSATASAAPPDAHTHRGSISDRAELREVLREHRERRDDSSSIVGLGIAGIGRRGLTGVHGKEENTDHSGAASPKSAVSTSTEGTARFGLFGRNSISTDTDAESEREKELREQMVEVQVERDMEKERKEDLKEMEDLRVVEAAIERSPTPLASENPAKRHKGNRVSAHATRRLVLRQPGRGKIVALEVLHDIDALCVLRDEGLLDIFSLTSLHSTAAVDLEAVDVKTVSEAATSSKSGLKIPPFWHWRGVHLAQNDDGHMIVANGLPWPCELPSANGEVTRVVMLALAPSPVGLSLVAGLELPGEGEVAICKAKTGSFLLHSTMTSFMSYPIIFPAISAGSQQATPQARASPQVRSVSSMIPSPYMRSATPDPSHSRQSSQNHHGLRKSASHTHLPAPYSSGAGKEKEGGFAKFLAAKRADWSRKGKEEDKPEEPSPGIGEGKEVERDGGGGWDNIAVVGREGLGWKGDAIDLFSCDGTKLEVRGTITLPDNLQTSQAFFSPGWKTLVVKSEDHIFIYQPQQGDEEGANMSLRFERIQDMADISTIESHHSNRIALMQADSVRSLDLTQPTDDPKLTARLSTTGKKQMSLICPANVESICTADVQGNVSTQRLGDLFTAPNSAAANHATPTSDRLDSPVTCLVDIPRRDAGSPHYMVAGDEDGCVRIFTTHPLKLCASFTLFADPVRNVALLNMPQAGGLQNCLLVSSNDGTVGIISLKEMDDLFLIPASRTPLRRVFIESKDILLAYANGKARLWNTKTQEFRRSTGLDAADDMLATGDWAEVTCYICYHAIRSCIHPSYPGRLLGFDLRDFGRWLHSSKNNPSHSPLAALRDLLSIFLTFGIDDRVDDICIDKLGVRKPSVPLIIGQTSDNGSSELSYARGLDAWHVSAPMTGLRQLVIVTLLRPFLDSPDHERWAAEAIAYYTASLPVSTIEPELGFFANYYMDSSPDVHQAARMLFAARVARMTSDAFVDHTVRPCSHVVPSRLTDATRCSEVAVSALTLIGGIALHKYQVMQPNVLKSIAESVSLLLHETKPDHLPLAVEICSKGFTTWQSYVDPSDLLRRLFHLATHKDFSTPSTTSSSSTSIAAQARLAVLHVASANPPLFMSTLSMDILDARSVEGRTSIMKLCVFMARKKPAVLENGLPRIAEAVVKSLDPNVGKMRDDVWSAATVILNELVLAFSTIDFHSGTQRLAVGTHEGAVIMYDLKTASRVYVLEPHKHPVSAVTFSPDGRRLITVSLEEGNVTVWKVGSSLSGFFNVGGPPRQGAEKGEPFKRIEFIRADDGPLNSTSALSDIQISWPGARQARVNIKETALTFET